MRLLTIAGLLTHNTVWTSRIIVSYVIFAPPHVAEFFIMNSWKDKFFNITWDNLRSNSFALSQTIAQSNDAQPDLIIAVARGGLTISQLLSDYLKLPIATFTIQSYKDLKQIQEPQVTYPMHASLSGKKILLVDDICDTGKTFLRSFTHLEELGAIRQNIKTCALIHKPHAQYTPDYFSEKTSAWVIMPYEVRETIEQVAPMWQKDGIPQETMLERFMSLGFEKDQVAEFLRHYERLS